MFGAKTPPWRPQLQRLFWGPGAKTPGQKGTSSSCGNGIGGSSKQLLCSRDRSSSGKGVYKSESQAKFWWAERKDRIEFQLTMRWLMIKVEEDTGLISSCHSAVQYPDPQVQPWFKSAASEDTHHRRLRIQSHFLLCVSPALPFSLLSYSLNKWINKSAEVGWTAHALKKQKIRTKLKSNLQKGGTGLFAKEVHLKLRNGGGTAQHEPRMKVSNS